MANEAEVENVDSLNDTEQDTDKNLDNVDDNIVADTVEPSDNVDELKEKLKQKDITNEKLYKRLKKAEGFEEKPDGSWVKVDKKPQEVKQVDNVSSDSLIDTLALVEAKVTNKEDVEVVKRYAKNENKTILEALDDDVVKAILADRLEKRNTASATNTGKARTGQTSVSGDALYNKAVKTGELPDRTEDLDKMLESRYTPKSKN